MCAKSSSCTSLCAGPVKARAELVSEYIVCVNEVLTDTQKLCVPAGNYTPGYISNKMPLTPRSLLGESYQPYQVRTSCITQKMRGEALEGDRRCSPRWDNDKLHRGKEKNEDA